MKIKIHGILLSLLLTTLVACSTHQPYTLPKDLPEQDTLSLQADFTDPTWQTGDVFDFFNVSVRTHKGSPNSVPATFGRRPQVNTVRMLGGWADKNIEEDTYKWDGKKFIYDFDKATKRIDNWLKNDWDIFQIVLDNPPWAFQRGIKFVDKPDGIHYLAKDAVGVYGNGLPPADKVAWNQYIKAFISHLVDYYGQEKVNSWRFRVGSEIDTRPQHWAATQEEFFEHYQNTVNAVHQVLPTLRVGAHFREASFKSTYVDYTGHTENSYAANFITWAKRNNVPYDFIAISYYPHITKPHELDMEQVYAHDMAPLQQHPDWDQNARLEIHEYRLISKMQRAGFISVATSHNASFFAMLSKLMLEKNIREIFQWGNARNNHYAPEALTQLALYPMVGNALYKNTIVGEAKTAGNLIDGIFTAKPIKNQITGQSVYTDYDVLLFNFNKSNLAYQKAEPVELKLTTKLPPGTQYKFRAGTIDKNTIMQQRFVADHPLAIVPESEGGWRKNNIHHTASLSKSLNEKGQALFLKHKNKYGKSSDLQWQPWQTATTQTTSTTTTTTSGKHTSNIVIKTEIPSFAVQKFEIRVLSNTD